MRFRSRNTKPVLTDEDVNLDNFKSLSRSIVEKLIDSEISQQDFVDYILNTPLLGDRELFKRKGDAHNIIYGLKRGNNLTEDRIELLLDLLGAEIYIKANEPEKEN
jgi:hypothetical protein